MNLKLEKMIKNFITPAPCYLLLILMIMFFTDTAYCVPLVLDPETKLSIFSQYIITTYDNGQNIVDILQTNEVLRNFVLTAETEFEIKKIADIYCNGFDEGIGFSVKNIVFR